MWHKKTPSREAAAAKKKSGSADMVKKEEKKSNKSKDQPSKEGDGAMKKIMRGLTGRNSKNKSKERTKTTETTLSMESPSRPEPPSKGDQRSKAADQRSKAAAQRKPEPPSKAAVRSRGEAPSRAANKQREQKSKQKVSKEMVAKEKPSKQAINKPKIGNAMVWALLEATEKSMDDDPKWTEEKGSKFEEKPSKFEEKGSKFEEKASKVDEKTPTVDEKAPKIAEKETKMEEKAPKVEEKIEEKVSKIEEKPSKLEEDAPKAEEKKEEKEEKEEEKERDEEETLIDLHEGDVIMGRRMNIPWKVGRQLGKGGFGKVHEVKNTAVRGGIPLACKTEAKNEDVKKRTQLRLKIEIDAMLAIYKSKTNTRHFAELVDYGRDKERRLKFIVMTMLGPSLADLRKQCYTDGGNYSTHTGIYVAQQTLEAIQNLHEIGFIHRDVKPQNFAVGRGDSESNIYLYDFGLSRRLYESNGKLRKPRENGKVKFIGTPRYASIASHERREQGRRDDTEAWLYMVFDLFDNEEGLRWKQYQMSDLHKFADLKRKFLQSAGVSLEERQMFCSALVPDCFNDFKDVIRSMKYEDRPPYEKFQEAISKAAIVHNVSANRCEWIGKGYEPSNDNKEHSFGAKQQGSITL